MTGIVVAPDMSIDINIERIRREFEDSLARTPLDDTLLLGVNDADTKLDVLRSQVIALRTPPYDTYDGTRFKDPPSTPLRLLRSSDVKSELIRKAEEKRLRKNKKRLEIK